MQHPSPVKRFFLEVSESKLRGSPSTPGCIHFQFWALNVVMNGTLQSSLRYRTPLRSPFRPAEEEAMKLSPCDLHSISRGKKSTLTQPLGTSDHCHWFFFLVLVCSRCVRLISLHFRYEWNLQPLWQRSPRFLFIRWTGLHVCAKYLQVYCRCDWDESELI